MGNQRNVTMPAYGKSVGGIYPDYCFTHDSVDCVFVAFDWHWLGSLSPMLIGQKDLVLLEEGVWMLVL